MPEDRQGTGKHPHKSTEEPYPHHEASQSKSSGQSQNRSESQSQQASGSESRELKEREYRDEQGNVHHHTNTYEEQHSDKKEDEAA